MILNKGDKFICVKISEGEYTRNPIIGDLYILDKTYDTKNSEWMFLTNYISRISDAYKLRDFVRVYANTTSSGLDKELHDIKTMGFKL